MQRKSSVMNPLPSLILLIICESHYLIRTSCFIHYPQYLLREFAGTSFASCDEKDPCRGLEVDLCLTQIVIAIKNEPKYTNRTRSEVIESGIEKQCAAFKRAGSCFETYAKNCATEEQRQFLKRLRNAAVRVKDEYCTTGTSLRSSYIKYGPCLRSVIKDPSHQCLIDLQAVTEYVTEAGRKDRIDLVCCALHRVKKCLSREVEKSCTSDSIDFIKRVGQAFGSRVIGIVCQEFEDPENPTCRMLPPIGSKPKGTDSTSVINKLIRTYTNNAPPNF